eukprot:gene5479-6031_t
MCEVNGFLVPAMVDTGAEISVMSTSCAKRCGLASMVDIQHSGRAIGVGCGEIVGGIDGLPLRIGPLSFQNKVSILRNSRCDFLIGMDILKRFKCEISLRDKMLRMYVRNEEVRISLVTTPGSLYCDRLPSTRGQRQQQQQQQQTNTQEMPMEDQPSYKSTILNTDVSTTSSSSSYSNDYYYEEEDDEEYDDFQAVSMEGV